MGGPLRRSHLANSALDRFAHRAHQIVMEGPSLRAASAPSPPKGKLRTSESAGPACPLQKGLDQTMLMS
jgi:hypothetical protein